jgi:long-chain-fatty-acid--[acyl-carrier-protein] ligase
MDPPNVFRALWGKFRMRPMLKEVYFKSPVLAPFAWLLRGIKVPDTDRASAEAKQRAEAAVAVTIATLKAGENVVFWPAGTLSRDGVERLGAARAAADVLKAVPHATLVLVRTRGLWGSSFSWARGSKPKLIGRLIAGFGWLALNLLIFSPRRRVHMHVEVSGPDERPEPVREVLNPWLERWYAADGGEPLSFTPYHAFLGPRHYSFPPPLRVAELDPGKVKPATREEVAHIVSDRLKRDITREEDRAETTLAGLGLDSLEAAEISLQVEQRFGFTGDLVPATLGQLWVLAEGQIEKGPSKPPPATWFNPPSDTGPYEILGETIPEAFLNRVARHPQNVAVADDIAGVLTYERLLVGALTMAARFRALPGENVGLLLPASVAADISLFGWEITRGTQLDNRASESGIRREADGLDAHRHFESLYRSDANRSPRHHICLPRRNPGRCRQVRVVEAVARSPLLRQFGSRASARASVERPAPDRGRAVHIRFRKSAEGSPVDSCQHHRQPAGSGAAAKADAC